MIQNGAPSLPSLAPSVATMKAMALNPSGISSSALSKSAARTNEAGHWGSETAVHAKTLSTSRQQGGWWWGGGMDGAVAFQSEHYQKILLHIRLGETPWGGKKAEEAQRLCKR